MPPQSQRSWFSRNLKWLIPVLVLVAMTASLSVFGLFVGFIKFLKSDDSCQGALAKARASQEVVALIGEPMEDGILNCSIKISVSNSSGKSTMSIPLKGPKGKGMLHAKATRKNGIWSYEQLRFVVPGRSDVNLLQE